jgi:hypothetical protein
MSFVVEFEKEPSPDNTPSSPDGSLSCTNDILLRYAKSPVERSYTHPRDVVHMMHDYAHEFPESRKPPIEMYIAGYAHDLIDAIESDHGQKALSEVLRSCSDEVDDGAEVSSRLLVAALVADGQIIEESAEKYRELQFDDGFGDILNSKEDVEVSPEHWLKEVPMMSSDQMLQLVNEVNIEALFIKAVEILHNLQNPPQRDAAHLQDIQEAEFFYAPICDVLGLHQLSAHITSAALQARLVKSNNGEYVQRAEKVLRGLDEDIHAFSDAMTGLFGSDIELEHKHMKNGRSGVFIFKDENYDDNHVVHTGAYRLKTIGSLAEKMYRIGGSTVPLDVLGIRVVVESWEEAVNVLTYLVTKADELDEFRFQKSDRRKHAISVRSSEEVYETTVSRMSDRGSDKDIEYVETNEEEFRNIKFTGLFGSLGVEVEVVPSDVHRNNVLGTASHILLKSIGIVNPESLAKINERVHRIGDKALNVNGQSKDRATTLLKALGL